MSPNSMQVVFAVAANDCVVPIWRPTLQFQISLNEEHVFLRVASGHGVAVDLGERAHHYCLLTLARRRLHDAQRGLDPTSQGWLAVDELARMLGVDQAHLNIQIYRARQHFAAALPRDMGMDVALERRRGEVRIGALPFRIVRGACLEGEFVPSPTQDNAQWGAMERRPVGR